ncbi:hypothetical protein NDU88_007349 [Pleurodeles waltl]|uniref:Uncharacterized protein n=1 Tax=Pleurodeles waltl TaxID=8319 RepID=A0AAV7UPW0_PLEWA|nr:hypothetical protein NDU88_007349 [Pleurodeles waltl]
MEKVLQAILDTKTSLEGKIDTVVAEVNTLRMEQRKLTERVATTEITLKLTQPDITDLKQRLQQQETEILRLNKRAEEAEGRSRRNTLRMEQRKLTERVATTEITLKWRVPVSWRQVSSEEQKQGGSR